MHIPKMKRLAVGVSAALFFALLGPATSASAAIVASTGLTLQANTPRTTATASNATATLIQAAGTIGKDAVAFRIQPPTGPPLYESAFRACTNAAPSDDVSGDVCTDATPTSQTTLESDSVATIVISYADANRADSTATAVLTIPASMMTIAGDYTIKAFFADVAEADTIANIEAAITANVNISTSFFTVTAAIAASAAGPYTFNAGTAITNLSLTPTGLTAPITYDVSPALPGNLTLNQTTGVISGTPQVAQTAANYIVTATGAGGAGGSITLSIAIAAVLLPSTQTAAGVVGSAMAPTSILTPVGFTGVATYTSSTRPAGLNLSSTGVISGTPTTAGTTVVTITGADSLSRTAIATVTITISAATITPATQTLLATAGTAITATTAFTPLGFTGAITYAVTPALPAGLTMSTTGVITGTPTGNQAATVHTITATGATNGTATATITITVSPRILPATQTLSVVAGAAITATTAFTAAGITGTVIYSVSPALPAGLTMSTTTGVITGTPTVSQAATTYTITATGTTAGSTLGTGSATATITITVSAAITPLTSALNLTLGVAMTPTAAYTLSGFSGVITYAVAPALPAGLVMSTTTGIITGTPAALAAAGNYVITASGAAAGLATTTVTITVFAPLAAPTAVTATAGNATASISWAAVVGATSYQVVSIPAGGVCAITATQATCSNLTNNTSYTFRVTAVNQAGAAALSTISAAVTPKPPFVTKTAKITVSYTVTGTVIPAASLIKIRALGTQFKNDKGTAAVISVKGFTTRKSPTAIEKRLAATRATLVTRALKAAGVTGQYNTIGNATTNRVGAKARKVVVKITYNAAS